MIAPGGDRGLNNKQLKQETFAKQVLNLGSSGHSSPEPACCIRISLCTRVCHAVTSTDENMNLESETNHELQSLTL